MYVLRRWIRSFRNCGSSLMELYSVDICCITGSSGGGRNAPPYFLSGPKNPSGWGREVERAVELFRCASGDGVMILGWDDVYLVQFNRS